MYMKRIAKLLSVLSLIGPACVQNPPGDPNPTTPPPGDGNGPVATFTIKKTALKATFDASGASSSAYAAEDLLVRWDYTDDGTFDTDWSATKTASYTYPEDGSYTARLEIKDPENRTDTATKRFTITANNTPPTAVFNVNIVQGMTASLDASSSSDVEDPAEELRIRWDFNGDNTYDTDWTTVKTIDHTYDTAGEYTIRLQVKDLNESAKAASQTIIASPITIRNSFITYGPPYMVGLHFRMINNLTGQPVTPADVPALTRAYFNIYENNVPIDLSETNQLLYNGKRPMFMVLLLDFTGSMYDAGAVAPMVDAAKAFIDSQGSTTWVSLWAFWERQGGNGEITDFTSCDESGKAQLKAALDTFAAAPRDRGATEIWDTLKDIVDNKFPPYDTGVNRGIVFLSDGHDTTSTTSLGVLIEAARKKAAFIFSVGMAFRPTEYPADEPNLKKIAEDTGGLYFTVNQVADLATVFNQLSLDVNADWTLSYITLRSSGTYTLKAICNYLGGYAVMTGKVPVTKLMEGDIKKGLLLVYPALDSPAGATEYTLYADYIPRNINAFRVKVSSASPAWLMLYGTDTICNPAMGWTISPDIAAGQAAPADGWYTISSASPLEYGSSGRLARCIVDATNLAPASVHFELPPLEEQAALYGDKTMYFEVVDPVTSDINLELAVDVP